MTSLWLRYPTIPQSVNSIYFTRGRKRILSSEGRKFKNGFIVSRGGLPASTLMKFEADPNAAYVLEMWFFLPQEKLYNKTFGQRDGVARFKKMDVSNLIKLAEDAISELLGIPDQNNFTVIAHKRVADEGERTALVARVSTLNLEEDPYVKPG